jgi:hypothetical protein
MKTRILGAALALFAAATVAAAEPAKKPETKLCANYGNGVVCGTAAAAPLVCTPPLELLCTPEGCICATIGTPPGACEVSITYPAGAPDLAEAKVPDYCDAGNAEIAVSTALTKLLKRP